MIGFVLGKLDPFRFNYLPVSLLQNLYRYATDTILNHTFQLFNFDVRAGQ